MGVRKIKKSYISCTGYFASHKNDRQIPFESTLERDVFMMMEFDRDVVSYEDQPFTMKYALNGRATKYTPDVLAVYGDGSRKVIEVKYQDEIDSDGELRQKLGTVKEAILEQYATEFRTFTDRDIDGVYLENCKFLYKFAFIQPDETMLARIVDLVRASHGGLSVKELLERVAIDESDQLRVLPSIWQAIFRDTRLVDLHEKLTMKTKLSIGGTAWER